MARQYSGQRGERFDDDAGGSWLDDRGVSEVIGSILVFGLLVALLAIVQTQAVPNANNEVEVKHNAEVQGDMANLQSAISRTVRFDGSETTTVATGLTYPPRLVLFNPPAVQGVLTTGEGSEVGFAGFTAPNEDTDEYVSNPGPFETHTISYRVDYNRYGAAPTTRYEHGVLYNEYDDGSVTVESGSDLVSGNHISLVMLRGGLQESKVGPASVTTYPRSAPAQSITVETDGSTGELTVPTELDDEVWLTEILVDQIDGNAPSGVSDCANFNPSSFSPDPGDDKYIVGCDSSTPGELTLIFEQGQTYDLRLAKTGFSADSQPLEPTYITDVTSGSTAGLVVEVRDKYNNPIERRVDLTLVQFDSDGDIRSKTSLKTGPNGRARLPGNVIRKAEVYLRVGPNAGTPPTSGRNSDCPSELGCANVEPPGLPASSLITVTGVRTGGQGVSSPPAESDKITLTFDNQGKRETKIDRVQLGYATQRVEQEITLSGGTLTCAVGGDDDCSFSSTFVDDGPDKIESISNSTDTFDPQKAGGAEENLRPDIFIAGSGSTHPGSKPELRPGSSGQEITFTLDEDVSVSSADSVDLSVTVYYEDGSVATYSRTLFAANGQNR